MLRVRTECRARIGGDKIPRTFSTTNRKRTIDARRADFFLPFINATDGGGEVADHCWGIIGHPTRQTRVWRRKLVCFISVDVGSPFPSVAVFIFMLGASPAPSIQSVHNKNSWRKLVSSEWRKATDGWTTMTFYQSACEDERQARFDLYKFIFAETLGA